MIVVASHCFTVVKSHELAYPLAVVLRQIFLNLTALFSYPVFFCFFHAHLNIVVHFPVFCRFFRFKSFHAMIYPFVAPIKTICSDPRVFSSGGVCQGSHRLLQSLLCWRWSSSSLFIMMRCSNFPPIIAWKVSNTLGSFSFSHTLDWYLYTVAYNSQKILHLLRRYTSKCSLYS